MSRGICCWHQSWCQQVMVVQPVEECDMSTVQVCVICVRCDVTHSDAMPPITAAESCLKRCCVLLLLAV